ncbi:uncharacterized protein [Primulina huaijiensis]|uniref:uncharacterized protein n=1 Tax=Primulina huaijiensis TaxID=1492673 RepID=UPI003CC78ADF
MFSAYGDFNAFPRRLREGCQRTGVKLIDVPNRRKDAADKAILVDMFLFALDNSPPSSISGDVDFAPALHNNSWPSVARGEGFVPPKKTLVTPRAEVTSFLMGCQINDYVDGLNEEESIVYRGISKGCYNSRDFSVTSQCLSEYCSSSPQYPTTSKPCSLPNGLNDISISTLTSCDQNDLTWVQPGDLNGLKGQLVKLLELAGGGLPLTRLPSEYQKIYGRPLYVSGYGAMKLVSLLKKMDDVIAIEAKGQKKFVCLRNLKCGPVGSPPLILARRDDKKGKGVQEDNNNDVMAGVGSSDEFSGDERVILGENDNAVGREKSIKVCMMG